MCKQRASLHCEPACVFSDEKLCYLCSYTGCNYGSSFHDAEACAFLNLYSSRRKDCTEHKGKVGTVQQFQSQEASSPPEIPETLKKTLFQSSTKVPTSMEIKL